MTDRSVVHDTFTLERTYAASPERVFRAWADPVAKRTWFGNPNDNGTEHTLDFRVGGREHVKSEVPDHGTYLVDAVYQDIVDGERIVYSYDMHFDADRISVSLVIVEIMPADAGTRLVYTEHGAYLDGHDKPEFRQHGTNELLDALGRSLA